MQAADLVFRKLINKNGDIINKFVETIKSESDSKNDKVKIFSKELNYYVDILSKFSDWIKDRHSNDKDDVSAAANDYLKTLGFVSLAYAWIKVLEVSFEDYDSNKKFYEDKINTAKYYFDKILPRVQSHYLSAITGSDTMMKSNFN